MGQDLGQDLEQAWRNFWELRKRRDEPGWARVLVASALAFSLSLALVLLAGLLRLSWADPAWWRGVALPLVCVGIVVGNTLLAAFRALELALPEEALERLQGAAGWRSSLLLNAVAAAAIVLGCALGIGLVGFLHDRAAWRALADPHRRIHLGLFLLVLVAANALAWSLRQRRRATRRRALEAQLHLLQAQIEPQFLFNTLADVRALLDRDPEGARLMLEEFTDYLRASLGQLRRADSTLGAELEMTRCYLQLLRLRMGERLRFSIASSVEARTASVPPLLLQPLVENAIKHGLDPQAGGGSVHIQAEVRDGWLEIAVRDDGIGLPAVQAHDGRALENIRARLQARHGARAELTLAAAAPGACASIRLPFVGVAVDSSRDA